MEKYDYKNIVLDRSGQKSLISDETLKSLYDNGWEYLDQVPQLEPGQIYFPIVVTLRKLKQNVSI